jgi:hypothetical protein
MLLIPLRTLISTSSRRAKHSAVLIGAHVSPGVRTTRLSGRIHRRGTLQQVPWAVIELIEVLMVNMRLRIEHHTRQRLNNDSVHRLTTPDQPLNTPGRIYHVPLGVDAPTGRWEPIGACDDETTDDDSLTSTFDHLTFLRLMCFLHIYPMLFNLFVFHTHV